MGRASRNVNGTVLLFADNMTDSLEKAITETARRRSVQEEFNKEHGITPKSVTRKLEDDLRINDPLGDLDERRETRDERWDEEYGDEFEPGIRPMEPLQPSSKTKKARGSRLGARGMKSDVRGTKSSPQGVPPAADSSRLEDLERQMKEAAARLDFEEAARLRDIIRDMK